MADPFAGAWTAILTAHCPRCDKPIMPDGFDTCGHKESVCVACYLAVHDTNCTVCQGHGRVITGHAPDAIAYLPIYAPCAWCGGTGKRDTSESEA